MAEKAGFASLLIYPGAESTGLGEAFLSLADGSQAIGWNPAGLTEGRSVNMTFSHNSWLAGMYHDYVSASISREKYGFGFAVTTLHVEDIEARDKASEKPLYTFTSTDFNFSLAYARKMSEKLATGIAVKFLYEKIAWDEIWWGAVDLGSNYRFNKDLRFSLALKNLAPKKSIDDEKIMMPIELRMGTAYTLPFDMKPARIIASMDLSQIYNERFEIYSGVQTVFYDILTVRFGLKPLSEVSFFSTGAGLTKGFASIDYSFTPFKYDLGINHRFELGISF